MTNMNILGNPFPQFNRYQIIDERTGMTVTHWNSLEEAKDYILTEGDIANFSIHDSLTFDVWWFDDDKWRKD